MITELCFQFFWIFKIKCILHISTQVQGRGVELSWKRASDRIGQCTGVAPSMPDRRWALTLMSAPCPL